MSSSQLSIGDATLFRLVYESNPLRGKARHRCVDVILCVQIIARHR